jgi:hypothetical protein
VGVECDIVFKEKFTLNKSLSIQRDEECHLPKISLSVALIKVLN